MAIVCRLLGHQINRRRVVSEGEWFYARCTRCGRQMRRELEGWRPWDGDAPEIAQRQPESRNQNIEILRIIAAFGIVVFHAAAPGAQIGYAGLIAFVALAVMFEAQTETDKSVRTLAVRLLVPWVFWTAIYIAFRMAVLGTPELKGMSLVQSVLYGGHLWFLPFIFVAVLITGRMRKLIGRDKLAIGSAVVVTALLAVAPWWRDLTTSATPPVAQWLHALPAVFIGPALIRKDTTALALAGVVLCAIWQIPGVSIPYAVGVAGIAAALWLPQVRWNVRPVSDAMFGVYLVHILALGVASHLVGGGTLMAAGLAFIASTAGVMILRSRVKPLLG